MTVALGRIYRFPFAPAAKSNEPIDMAWPRHNVCIGDWMYWNVSYNAKPTCQHDRWRWTCSDASTGRVDVHWNRFLGIISFEEEELGDYQRTHVVVDLTSVAKDKIYHSIETYYPFLEEAWEYIVCPFRAALKSISIKKGIQSAQLHTAWNCSLTEVCPTTRLDEEISPVDGHGRIA